MIKNEGEQQVLRNAIVRRNWRRGSRLRTPRSRRDRIVVIFISLQVFSFLDSKRKASCFARAIRFIFFFWFAGASEPTSHIPGWCPVKQRANYARRMGLQKKERVHIRTSQFLSGTENRKKEKNKN